MLVSISTPSVPSSFINPVKQPNQLLVGYELGGVTLQDPSQGLMVQMWTLQYSEGSFYVTAPNQPGWIELFSDSGVTECDLAFDQNMFPFVVYLANGIMKFFWFNPSTSEFEIVSVGAGYRTPRCTLDDKRPFDVGNSDIHLSYINLSLSALCDRVQRDRYAIEYNLAPLPPTCYLNAVNFNEGTRLQWSIGQLTTIINLIPLAVTAMDITSYIEDTPP